MEKEITIYLKEEKAEISRAKNPKPEELAPKQSR